MYNAIIGKIKIYPHPNADRLKMGVICNTTVVVGLNIQENDLMMLFPSDGQLSETFAISNNLISYSDPQTGEKKGGYFAKNRRVRAQKLRGVSSDGFACELSLLKNAGVSQKTIDSLKKGDQFNELDYISICNKYITPATKQALAHKANQVKKTNKRFPEHYETKQLRYEIDKIPNYSILYINLKVHGTSARYSFVHEEIAVKPPWFKRIFGAKPKTKLEYRHQVGTRRVILDNENVMDFHGNVQYRYDFMKDIFHLLKKGELIYGEIAGYQSENVSIMPSVSTSTIKDKSFSKKYGPTITYKYGCPNGTHKFFVYRIAMINEDGYIIDLPWLQTKKRAMELGLQCVPEFEGPFVYDGNKEELLNKVLQYVDGPDPLDETHIREGVVVRIENENGVSFLKEKSFNFKVLEGIAKDNADYIDLEEQEG